jgi:hypothetical protein
MTRNAHEAGASSAVSADHLACPRSGAQIGSARSSAGVIHDGMDSSRSRIATARWLLFDRLKPEGGDIWLLEQSRAAN